MGRLQLNYLVDTLWSNQWYVLELVWSDQTIIRGVLSGRKLSSISPCQPFELNFYVLLVLRLRSTDISLQSGKPSVTFFPKLKQWCTNSMIRY
jgi:hypothetical protein